MLSARTCSPVVLCNPSTYSGKLCPSCFFYFRVFLHCMQCSEHRALGKSFLEIKMQMRRKVFFFVLFFAH